MTARLRYLPRSTQKADAHLLARVAEGDLGAAHTFVLRHQAEVRRFVARMLGARDASVDDVTQVTFVAALDAAGRFGQRSAVRTWLIGIAHNKVRMHIRSQMRRRRAFEILAQLRLVATPPLAGPPSTTLARIEEAVASLPPDLRAVFVLCDVEGRTGAEAAECLGVPGGTVRRWRSEARQALQPLLADLWPAGENT